MESTVATLAGAAVAGYLIGSISGARLPDGATVVVDGYAGTVAVEHDEERSMGS